MILPGEPALWIDYGTDYFVVSFPSKVGYYVIIKKLYVFFVSFVFFQIEWIRVRKLIILAAGSCFRIKK